TSAFPGRRVAVPRSCGAGFTPASGVASGHSLVIPPPSAGINPAPQKRKDLRAPGAPRRGSPLLWGRLYAGQRSRVRAPAVIPAPVARDEPGLTKKKGRDLRAPGAPRRGSPLLWGRLYAGQRRRARAPVVIPPTSAGINPAPQNQLHNLRTSATKTSRLRRESLPLVRPTMLPFCVPGRPGTAGNRGVQRLDTKDDCWVSVFCSKTTSADCPWHTTNNKGTAATTRW